MGSGAVQDQEWFKQVAKRLDGALTKNASAINKYGRGVPMTTSTGDDFVQEGKLFTVEDLQLR